MDANAAGQLGTFLGRETDADRLTELTSAGRLVTVVGPDGSGTTRLVTETARGWRLQGVVELAAIGPHGDPAAAALAACGVREEPGRTATDLLAEHLCDSSATLVLDTCEHVRGPVAAMVAELLHRCPGLTVVATSRVPLGVPGERVLPLAGLDPDGAGADLPAENTGLGDDGGRRAGGPARRATGRRGRPRTGWDSLTPTEREVVALVATGMSNAQIGTRLLVSPGTVRTHLRSVFEKLGVSSRADLAHSRIQT